MWKAWLERTLARRNVPSEHAPAPPRRDTGAAPDRTADREEVFARSNAFDLTNVRV